jgi:hypothetical protein
MSIYSQFLTPVDAVTVPANDYEPAVVGTTVDFGVVHDGFTAWACSDPSSTADVTVFVDSSIDNETWVEAAGEGTTVGIGLAQIIAVPAGRYVRVRGNSDNASDTVILTVQVAVEC